jgi:hypothetical protein
MKPSRPELGRACWAVRRLTAERNGIAGASGCKGLVEAGTESEVIGVDEGVGCCVVFAV